MQAYKLRKTFETVIYPVEDELRGIREENEKSWKKIICQVGSVVFSGIGTTIAFQDDFLPVVIRKYSPCNDAVFLFLLQFFSACFLFAGVTFVLWWMIRLKSKASDKKRYDKDRRELAEYFHKVILNNVLTGISFTKRAWNKKRDYNAKEELIQKLDKSKKGYDKIESNCRESQNYYVKEIKLYISEALFYFKLANKQFENKKIFETGMRREYIEFIDIVGLSTFKNLFDMYTQSYNNLEELNVFIDGKDNQSDIKNIGIFLNSKKMDLKGVEENYLAQKHD